MIIYVCENDLFTNKPRHDKINKVTVRPAKTQFSLGIRPVWSESSLCAWRKLGSLATHWAQAKTLIRLGGCPGWSVSSQGAHSFRWFCHVVAQITLLDLYQSSFESIWKRYMFSLLILRMFPKTSAASKTESHTSIVRYIVYMSHDMTKPTKWVCAQRRLRSAWASAQSDQSLLCALNG